MAELVAGLSGTSRVRLFAFVRLGLAISRAIDTIGEASP